MGRRANQRQPWTVYDERGTAFINATIAGERVRESLRLPYPRSGRASDAREAESAAAKRYAELVSGRVEKPTARIRTAHTLRELLAMWIVEHAKLCSPSPLRSSVVR